MDDSIKREKERGRGCLFTLSKYNKWPDVVLLKIFLTNQQLLKETFYEKNSAIARLKEEVDIRLLNLYARTIRIIASQAMNSK